MAADAGRNTGGDGIRESCLHRLKCRGLNAREQCADAADREAVAPVCVGHRVDGTNESGQQRDVTELRIDLVVHLLDLLAITVEDARCLHRRLHRQAPLVFTVPFEFVEIHASHVYDALRPPLARRVLFHEQFRIGCALDLDGRLVPFPVHGLSVDQGIELAALQGDLPGAE